MSVTIPQTYEYRNVLNQPMLGTYRGYRAEVAAPDVTFFTSSLTREEMHILFTGPLGRYVRAIQGRVDNKWVDL